MVALIIVFAIIAWFLPKTFQYLIIVPFVGTGLGGLLWGILGLTGIFGDLSMFNTFVGMVISGWILVALFIRKYDS